MSGRIAALLLALAAATAAQADQAARPATKSRVQVSVDASLARRTLELMCSGREVDASSLGDSPVVQQMLRHMARFDARITPESYSASQRKWAQCRAPVPDLFDFAAMKERRAEALTALARIDADPATFEKQIVELLAAFLPADFVFSARVHLIAGSNSCGMASGGVLLVDLRCTGDDIAGLQYLIAHEVYHGAQERFFQPAQENATDAAHALEYLFSNLLTEGSAVYLADFSRLPAGGRYVNQSQRIQRRSLALSEYNHRLFAFTLEHVMNAHPFTRERAETAYLIGYSGAFDSPFYYVGYELVRAVDEGYGRTALLCLLSLPPEQLVLAANELAHGTAGRARNLAPLDAVVLEAARYVARELDRSADAFRQCLSPAGK